MPGAVDDPFDLQRFVDAQSATAGGADAHTLKLLQGGKT